MEHHEIVSQSSTPLKLGFGDADRTHYGVEGQEPTLMVSSNILIKSEWISIKLYILACSF